MKGQSRREKYRKRARRKLFVRKIVLFALLLIIGIFILVRTGSLNVNSITVTGSEEVSKEEIIKRSGLKVGENYFSIPKKERIKAINSIAKIKSSDIKFSLSRKATINVDERKGIIQVGDYTNYYIIDKDLRIIDILNSPVQNLKYLTGASLTNLDLGDDIFPKEKVKREFLKKLFKEDIFSRLDEIQMESDSVVFIESHGIEIDFGKIDNVDYKFKMLNEILKDIDTTGKKALKIEMEKGSSPIVELESTYEGN
ncbi:cell division protein FtsQ/DivIB [Peptoniphilus catoniae]|uniref:cell division protein FtsQ/DivIB n=1 Tax=Peptoniphilus catoniae TaxID=1660341 RepID=UPI0010FD35D1|nr:FtsQ-type POTRA domain-containing protein [Peptoniphilus catoniae]